MGAFDLILDAGALIQFERRERRAVEVMARARERGGRLFVPAGVVGRVWRNGARQVDLVHLLGAAACTVVPLDDRGARACGQLCGASGTTDVIDAHVARCARETGGTVLTSDGIDLARLDPGLRIYSV